MEYYHFFVDAWRMFRKYKVIAINTEEYFNAVFEAAHKLAGRYSYEQFAKDITLAIVEQLIRIAEQGGPG